MIKRYGLRLQKWARFAMGTSYQHVPQEEGLFFRPALLDGYFNDLRHKAAWTGAIRDGVPVVRTDTNPAFMFPIAIFQWALGNWDLWLASGRNDQASLVHVMAAANWAIRAQTTEGGWLCWTGLARPTISPFSAMAQGQGASLLVRAASVADAGRYHDAARQAITFMLNSGSHGLVRRSDGWTSLEEYPGETLPAVLNGWIFALVGLSDWAVASRSEAAQADAREFAASLATALPLYDNGYWSRYDLGGNIASPFYHDLHIAQLRALARLFPAEAARFLQVADRFEGYRLKRLNRMRSIMVKVGQKLAQPTIGEIAQ